MKDFWTKHILIRCDGFGDLYPVTSPTPQTILFVASSHWHQRLGHPNHHVFKLLANSHFIPCSSNKLPSLCHSCQMGKHVKLPFSLSNTISKSPFDLSHFDVLSSPMESISGINITLFT